MEKYYNSFYRELAEIDARHNNFSKIAGQVKCEPGMKVLDIGAGYGNVTVGFVERGCDTYAIEINQDAVVSLQQKGIKVIEQNLNESFTIPYRFDLITALDILEHVFDPLHVLGECHKLLTKDGQLLIIVPLYFDLMDRLRILFSGSIISYDNIVYGKRLYNKFRSYNYDHIRFFRPWEFVEMVKLSGFTINTIKYSPMFGRSLPSKIVALLLANRFTVDKWPSLLAHSMTIRAIKSQ
ncbi:Class I SAM-dependent methyltransferase [Gammaproteobacteria bacterium]